MGVGDRLRWFQWASTDDSRQALVFQVALLWLVAIPAGVIFADTCPILYYKVAGNTFSISATESYDSFVNALSKSTAEPIPTPSDYDPWFQFFGIAVASFVFATATVQTALIVSRAKRSDFLLSLQPLPVATAWFAVITTILWTLQTAAYADQNTLGTGQDVVIAPCSLICAGISSFGIQLVLLQGENTR